MLNFNTDFYRKLFEAMDSNAVVMRIGPAGAYVPVWCSREYAEMMEMDRAECLENEQNGLMNSVHPEDRPIVQSLIQSRRTPDGSNSLTIRKLSSSGRTIWVNVHFAFVEDDGASYCYCTYTDVTRLVESEHRTRALYNSAQSDLQSLSRDALTMLRVNLTTNRLEEIRGSDMQMESCRNDIVDVDRWKEAFPIESEWDRFLSRFSRERLLAEFEAGRTSISDVFMTCRPDGRLCFAKCSAELRRDPESGDILSFYSERDYNNEMVNQTILHKALVEQYDMIAYLVDDSYGVVIGDAARIGKGSIFPLSAKGSYREYLDSRVIPVLAGTPAEIREMADALSPDRVRESLARAEPYQTDISCRIDGEIFHKRFVFYIVSREARFYILLKSDITDLIREQSERERTQTVFNGMIEQLNAMADESLAIIRCNLTTNLIEDVRGSDLYDSDVPGGSHEALLKSRLDSFLVEGDAEKFRQIFDPKSMLELTESGGGPAVFVAYCRRRSGRQCFVKFSGAAIRNTSGDVTVFGVEAEYNTEMVNLVLDEKVLSQQYDMITHIVSGYYGVAIGDASSIRGSIFPESRSGRYMDYISSQVIPAVAGGEEEKSRMLRALSLDAIETNLERQEPYTVDVNCSINGEIYNKRFMFYTVDRARRFYILLKSDMTEILRQQKERNDILATALQEAERANAAKTSFLSSMSHEIRTPMNAIIGLDSIALKDPSISASTREYLEKIGSSARHLLSLINDILDMSRIESGRLVLRNEEFSFGEALEQISAMINSQCQNKGLSYECRIRGHVDEYYIGDDMKLKQVLINILGNAVKFTPQGGRVCLTVTCRREFDGNAALRFVISDTGIGMDKDYLPRIFDAFSQEDQAATNAFGGTGLGMAITKNIVEMMNGSISVKSEKGKGTEFTVNVTLRKSERSGAIHRQLKPEEMRVLIVDDDPVACQHAHLVLEEVGIPSETAQSGRQAIEMTTLAHARHKAYNLILVDWKMPEQDGIEVTREIRRIVGNDMAIIILTAYSWDDVMQEALSAGVDSFMAKPLFASAVMDEFDRAIKQKRVAETPEKRRADLAGRRVLLAEDVMINAEIMKRLLAMKSMEVDHAANGQLAAEMFAASAPGCYDAVLMDVRMPVMDGLKATETIRAMDRADAQTVPIIAMTANAFDEDVQRSLQAGMNAHLSKPVEPEVLFETLSGLIRD